MALGDDNVIEGLANDEEDDGVYLFGTDISKIPCFRNSFMTGIYSGFGCGIASFLATSRVLQSIHISMIAFGIATYGYWFNCRMKWAKSNFNTKQFEETFVENIEEYNKKSRK